jgi:peptidoglycan/LPS O-acetylase OafA/YrhL
MRYSAPLDGIRAIAILAVLVFHVVPRWAAGGFTGVDVFFVLSGFLITSIILHDLREARFSLGEFYARRVQRLVPNAAATVLAVVVLWALLMPPSAARLAARHGVWAVANLSNFFIWSNLGGYWGDAADTAPLLHTWSLAIEEQFYLLFPGALVLLARFQRDRVTAWLAALGAASLALCVATTDTAPVTAFNLLPARVWELLLGAVVASLATPLAPGAPSRPRLGPGLQEAAGWAGLAVVAAGFVLVREEGFPGAIALVPTVGTTLVVLAATGENRVSRLLGSPALAWIGKRSYSLYLWHWPFITLGKQEAQLRGLPAGAGAAAGAAVGVALGLAAYHLVEQPLRTRGPGRRWRLAASAAMAAAVLATAAWRGRPPGDRAFTAFDPPEFKGLLYAAGKISRWDPTAVTRYQDVRFPSLAGKAEDAWRSGGIVHPWGGGDPEVVVLGSSHALMYSRLVDDLCRSMGLSVAFLGVDETPALFTATVNESFPTADEAEAFDALRVRVLREWRPRAVIVVDRWSLRVDGEGRFEGELRDFLSAVTPLAGAVILVAQVPTASTGDGVNLRELAEWHTARYGAPPRIVPDRLEPRRLDAIALAEAARAEFPNLVVLRPDRAFLRADGSIRWAEGRTSYYADDDHLSEAGADHVRDVFRDAIARAAGVVTASRGLRRPHN